MKQTGSKDRLKMPNTKIKINTNTIYEYKYKYSQSIATQSQLGISQPSMVMCNRELLLKLRQQTASQVPQLTCGSGNLTTSDLTNNQTLHNTTDRVTPETCDPRDISSE